MALDCFVFPLGGVDMILGVAWLETLGNIKLHLWEITTLPLSNHEAREISSSQHSQLSVLLQQHCQVFGEPKDLPPSRTNHHQIVLKTGTTLLCFARRQDIDDESTTSLLTCSATATATAGRSPVAFSSKMTSHSVNYSGSAIGINAEYDFDSEMPSPEQQPEPKSPSIEEVEQPNSEEPKPKRAKSTTSDVWKSFTKIGMVDGKEKAKCNGCGKEYIVGGIRYGTSSLLRHIPKCVALPKYHNIGTMMLDAQGKLRSRQLDHKRLQEVMAMAVIET
nr:zinc finger BED domain-containing protein RICESLEEPER 2-like [Ipomoea batatas]